MNTPAACSGMRRARLTNAVYLDSLPTNPSSPLPIRSQSLRDPRSPGPSSSAQAWA